MMLTTTVMMTDEQFNALAEMFEQTAVNDDRADEDAYWDAREAALNDEHIDAECAARALGY